MKDIKKYYLKNIADSPDKFAFENNSPTDDLRDFKRYLKAILDAEKETETRSWVKDLIQLVVKYHGKDVIVGGATEAFQMIEIQRMYSRSKQRLHYLHLPNVFLLGLLIFNKSSVIRKKVYKEIKRTSKKIEDCQENGLTYKYSGGSLKGEFLFRWRLASLCHDLGYIISLDKRMVPTEGFAKLNEIPFFNGANINSIEDMYMFGNHNLLKILNSTIQRIDLETYIKIQRKYPFEGNYYDHGMMGALIFLRFMYGLFEAFPDQGIVTLTNGTRICANKILLKTSILQVAKAIALHNIEKHNDAFDIASGGSFKFYSDRDALSCLLKISDMLQEWDKPRIGSSGILCKKTFNIEFRKNHLLLKDFPVGNICEIQETVSRFSGLKKYVRFKIN
jgi:hypothetical protein